MSLAKYRPRQPILALSMSASVVKQVSICSGVIALKIPSYIGTDNLIQDGINYALERGLIKKKQKITVILGKTEENLISNTIKVITAGI